MKIDVMLGHATGSGIAFPQFAPVAKRGLLPPPMPQQKLPQRLGGRSGLAQTNRPPAGAVNMASVASWAWANRVFRRARFLR